MNDVMLVRCLAIYSLRVVPCSNSWLALLCLVREELLPLFWVPGHRAGTGSLDVAVFSISSCSAWL